MIFQHAKKNIFAFSRYVSLKDYNVIISIRGSVFKQRRKKYRKEGDKCFVRCKSESDIVTVKGLF